MMVHTLPADCIPCIGRFTFNTTSSVLYLTVYYLKLVHEKYVLLIALGDLVVGVVVLLCATI